MKTWEKLFGRPIPDQGGCWFAPFPTGTTLPLRPSLWPAFLDCSGAISTFPFFLKEWHLHWCSKLQNKCISIDNNLIGKPHITLQRILVISEYQPVHRDRYLRVKSLEESSESLVWWQTATVTGILTKEEQCNIPRREWRQTGSYRAAQPQLELGSHWNKVRRDYLMTWRFSDCCFVHRADCSDYMLGIEE